MKTLQLETLAADLESEFRRDPRGRGVARLLEEYARESADWQELANFDPATYTRNLVHRNEDFELLLLCWEAGQESPIHDHMGQCCWMAVLDGDIEEVHFRTPDPGCVGPLERGPRRTLPQGQVAYISDDIALHLIRPTDGRRGASLHLYAKPIERAKIYAEDTGQVVLKTLSYDTVAGRCVDSWSGPESGSEYP